MLIKQHRFHPQCQCRYQDNPYLLRLRARSGGASARTRTGTPAPPVDGGPPEYLSPSRSGRVARRPAGAGRAVNIHHQACLSSRQNGGRLGARPARAAGPAAFIPCGAGVSLFDARQPGGVDGMHMQHHVGFGNRRYTRCADRSRPTASRPEGAPGCGDLNPENPRLSGCLCRGPTRLASTVSS